MGNIIYMYIYTIRYINYYCVVISYNLLVIIYIIQRNPKIKY